MENPTVEVREPTCDACAMTLPAFAYKIPKGTTLWHSQDVATGQQTQLVSGGLLGLCEDCHLIVKLEGKGGRAARALARRIVDTNPKLSVFHGEGRKRILAASTRMWERLLPLLTDPRPATDEERKSVTNLWREENLPQPEPTWSFAVYSNRSAEPKKFAWHPDVLVRDAAAEAAKAFGLEGGAPGLMVKETGEVADRDKPVHLIASRVVELIDTGGAV
jgi:hypothetical protein